MRDIVVVGSLNVDVSVRAERLPRPGETVRASGRELGPGGKGGNQAIAAARLGGRVHMVGRVGEDRFSDIPLAALTEAGVDATYVHVSPTEPTGTALILVEEGSGQNQIAVAGGANRALSPEDVQNAVAAFRAAEVLLVQLEAPLETVEAALDLARECGVQTVFDPAPAMDLPDSLLQKADVLTPNELETEALTGMHVQDVESAAVAGAALRDRSLGDVVVTLGAEGCVWVFASGFEHVPAPPVRAVDTTGAGDAFTGALGVALARGDSMPHALRFAVRAGTAATLRRGAALAMPTAAQLDEL
jgi:ribokinase